MSDWAEQLSKMVLGVKGSYGVDIALYLDVKAHVVTSSCYMEIWPSSRLLFT